MGTAMVEAMVEAMEEAIVATAMGHARLVSVVRLVSVEGAHHLQVAEASVSASLVAVLAFLLPSVASSLLAWAFLTFDERRLPASSEADLFPPATRALAIVFLGLFAVPVHVFRTRRGAKRLVHVVLAIAVVLGVLLVLGALAELVAPEGTFS
jgi:hypothetical protein